MLGIGSYYETQGQLGRIDPGIDVSHYGAPYQGMLGLGGCAGCGGLGAWTGTPSEDPRMVKRHTIVRATWRPRGLASGASAEAAQRIHYQGRQAFPGSTVRKIGSTGWIGGGRVGYEVILAQSTRAGEIKQKNFQAGQRAARGMEGGSVTFAEGRTAIPANGFAEAAPDTPPVPEETPTAPPGGETEGGGSFLTDTVGGVPVWAIGGLGVVALGGLIFAMTRKKKVAANRRRRARRRRRR